MMEDPLEGANCGLCSATADNFHVTDELWERVGLGSVQACFKCFRIAAWHAGVTNDGNPWETYGDAVQDPTTRLGASAAQCAADRVKRIEAAKKIAEQDGITLEQAIAKVWGL